MSDLEKLQRKLGYTFSDSALLMQAVTHRSHSSTNNERLEFLGDSVLNLSITRQLFTHFPSASEGDLSRLRAGLVNQTSLADIARELDLGDDLIMGSGEMKSGGFNRDSILSDALEAIFGAVYLDTDFNVASKFILDCYGERLSKLTEADFQKDPKSRLQEYLQGIGEPVPEYVLVASRGKAPNQEFDIECRTGPLQSAVKATGTSRRKAEQQAAAAALEQLQRS